MFTLDDADLTRLIGNGLRGTIKVKGPITSDLIPSAAKRVLAALRDGSRPDHEARKVKSTRRAEGLCKRLVLGGTGRIRRMAEAASLSELDRKRLLGAIASAERQLIGELTTKYEIVER